MFEANKLSFFAISRFLDSFKNLPKGEDNKNEIKQQRRELGFNNTAVSRIASQGYGLIRYIYK